MAIVGPSCHGVKNSSSSRLASSRRPPESAGGTGKCHPPSTASSGGGGATASRSSSFRIVEHSEITGMIEIQLAREEKLKAEILGELTSMKEEILERIASEEQSSMRHSSLQADFFRSITEKAMEKVEQKLSKQDRISSTILEFLKEQNSLIRSWLEVQAAAATTDEITSADGISQAGTEPVGGPKDFGKPSCELACLELGAGSSGRSNRPARKRGGTPRRSTVAAAPGGSSSQPRSGSPAGRHGGLLPECACLHFTTFNGDLYSQDAEWWLNRMDLYFEAVGNRTDEQKIAFAALHFVDTALIWWLDYKNKVAYGERDALNTWADFRKLFGETFFLESVQLDLRRRFYGLEQQGSVRDYSTDFWRIAVRLKGFPEKEKLFKYIYGLKDKLQDEVLERHPTTLAEAFYLAKNLESARPPSGILVSSSRIGFSGLLHARSRSIPEFLKINS